MSRLGWVAALLFCLLSVGCSASGKLLETLRDNDDPGQRAAAAEALGKLSLSDEKKATVVAALAAATVDPSPTVREKATEALGKLGGEEATKALARTLTGDNFKQAALESYERAHQLGSSSPEVLLGLARGYTEAGGTENLKNAEAMLNDLVAIIDTLDPQSALQQVYSAKFGYETLKLKLQEDGQAERAKAIEEKIAKIDAKIEEFNASGAGAGMPFLQ